MYKFQLVYNYMYLSTQQLLAYNQHWTKRLENQTSVQLYNCRLLRACVFLVPTSVLGCDVLPPSLQHNHHHHLLLLLILYSTLLSLAECQTAVCVQPSDRTEVTTTKDYLYCYLLIPAGVCLCVIANHSCCCFYNTSMCDIDSAVYGWQLRLEQHHTYYNKILNLLLSTPF